jgi:hypothetical protein
MSFYAADTVRQAQQRVKTAAAGVLGFRAIPVRLQWSAAEAAAAATDGVHAAAGTYGTGPVTVSTGITNPPSPRNLTATTAGTAADIKAGTVEVTGTNINDEVITETLPTFTVDSATTVVGNKAFKTVTSYIVPDMDGDAATVAIGFGDKLGLPFLSDTGGSTVLLATLAGVREATLPTMVGDADEIEKNTVDLASALAGTAVDVYLLVG